QPRELVVGQGRQVGVADQRLARGEPIEPGQAVHERRLPRTRRAHDRGESARFELEIHLVQGDDGGVAASVDLGGSAGGSRCGHDTSFLYLQRVPYDSTHPVKHFSTFCHLARHREPSLASASDQHMSDTHRLTPGLISLRMRYRPWKTSTPGWPSSSPAVTSNLVVRSRLPPIRYGKYSRSPCPLSERPPARCGKTTPVRSPSSLDPAGR